jgi:hypothetical protein
LAGSIGDLEFELVERTVAVTAARGGKASLVAGSELMFRDLRRQALTAVLAGGTLLFVTTTAKTE